MTQPQKSTKRPMSSVWEEEQMREEFDARLLDPVNPCVRSSDLLRLLDGELKDSDRARVEAHLASCPLCRGSLQGLREGMAGETLPELVPGSFLIELMKDLQIVGAENHQTPTASKPG